MQGEQTFYSDGGVTVTGSRIAIGQNTYTMANVTMVTVTSKIKPVWFMVGTLMLFAGIFLFLVPALVLAIYLILAKPYLQPKYRQYYLVFFMAGQQVSVLGPNEADYIYNIKNAIDQAIASRSYIR